MGHCEKEAFVTEQSVGDERFSIEKEPEPGDIHNPEDSPTPQRSVEALLKQNDEAKRSMAEELSQMGFSGESIRRILHVRLNTGKRRGDYREEANKRKGGSR